MYILRIVTYVLMGEVRFMLMSRTVSVLVLYTLLLGFCQTRVSAQKLDPCARLAPG